MLATRIVSRCATDHHNSIDKTNGLSQVSAKALKIAVLSNTVFANNFMYLFNPRILTRDNNLENYTNHVNQKQKPLCTSQSQSNATEQNQYRIRQKQAVATLHIHGLLNSMCHGIQILRTNPSYNTQNKKLLHLMLHLKIHPNAPVSLICFHFTDSFC